MSIMSYQPRWSIHTFECTFSNILVELPRVLCHKSEKRMLFNWPVQGGMTSFTDSTLAGLGIHPAGRLGDS